MPVNVTCLTSNQATGDPMPPYLFTIVMETLKSDLEESKNQKGNNEHENWSQF